MRVWIWILGTCGKAGCTSVNPASVGGRGRWGLGAHWPASLPEGVSSRLSADPVPKTKMENDRGPTPTSGFHRTIQACVRLHTQKHTLKRSIPEQLYFFLGENPLCYKKDLGIIEKTDKFGYTKCLFSVWGNIEYWRAGSSRDVRVGVSHIKHMPTHHWTSSPGPNFSLKGITKWEHQSPGGRQYLFNDLWKICTQNMWITDSKKSVIKNNPSNIKMCPTRKRSSLE